VLAVLTSAVWWGDLHDRSVARLSIAVMPFEDLRDDATEAYLGEGLAYELTTELSRLPDLFVISHSTARTFRENWPPRCARW
jgi:serine/threonine-protein kinase